MRKTKAESVLVDPRSLTPFEDCTLEQITPNLLMSLKSIFKDAARELMHEKIQPPDALWNMQQTADFLGIKPQTLSFWNSNGKGPAPTKIEGRTMYRPEIVRQYAKDKTLPRGAAAQ